MVEFEPATPTMRDKIVNAILDAGNDVWREDAEEAADAILRLIGFNQIDVDALEQAAGRVRVEQWILGDGSDMATALLALAARIAALLPPRADA